MGKKKQPIYKVVAADARSPRDGKFLEAVGVYNPLTNPHTVDLKEDRINYWLDHGAQPTDTVKSLLSQKGINLKRDLASRKFSAEKAETILKDWQNLKEASAQKKTVKKKNKANTEEAKTEEQPKS
jgi:small subunit ribosomal protein S16